MNAQDFEKKICLKREYIKILINLQSVGNGKMLGVLPSELLPAKVAVARGLAVDGVLEVQVLDDAARTQVEVVLDDLQQLLLGVLGGAVVKHSDRNGLCHADGVRHLYSGALANFASNQGLCYPTGGVSCRSVNLGVVLP